MKAISTKRVYDPPAPEDGARFLVDRLWPRGVKKASLNAEGWLKEVAPSQALRAWFNHQPERWEEFQRRYAEELEANPQTWESLLQKGSREKLTLLYGARDTEHNNAVALKVFLETRGKKPGHRARPAKSRAASVTRRVARTSPRVSSR